MKVTLAVAAASSLLIGCSTAPRPDISTDWVQRNADAAHAVGLIWKSVASDSTGTHVVAAAVGTSLGDVSGLWTSADSGATWINRTAATHAPAEVWEGVASDSTGTHLVAVANDQSNESYPSSQHVWTSADSGKTWTKRKTMLSTSGYLVPPLVVSDATGAHLLVADGDIWTSSDWGVTWIDQTVTSSANAQSWVGVASNASGAHIVGATAYGDVLTSADFGATWINRTAGTPASGQEWAAVASDTTGSHLVAVAAGTIWTSTDAGAVWVKRPAPAHNWSTVASDATGTRLLAGSANEGSGPGADDMWASDDGGATWVDATAGTAAANQDWMALASDATGTHVIALSGNAGGAPFCCAGSIWTN